jgi:iron complex outermembrane receptor protein
MILPSFGRLRALTVLSLVAWSAAVVVARAAEAATSFTLSGVVRTADLVPVAGATVEVEGQPAVLTDAQGRFRLEVPGGGCRLRIAHPGFAPAARALVVDADIPGIDVVLVAVPYRYEENVVVRAVRAEARAPVTTTNLDRETLAARNLGQEVPALLLTTPSVTQYADAGSSSGYSYLSLRGIQQTRLNVTLDGVPLNEPEDSAVYFSNYGDLAASIGSVQIQRGTGVSAAGAASYGGSVNFASLDPADRREVAVELGGGSYATRHAALTLHSGPIWNDLALYARASVRDTDGYRERSGVSQRAVFFGATRRGDRSLLKSFGFVGAERTQLAFLAVEPLVLEQNRRFNPLATEERDRFAQGLGHVQYTRFLGPATSLTGQVYYQAAGGWYRLWADAARETLYEYGLDWRYGGGMFNVQHVEGDLTVTAGAHGYLYQSRHRRDATGLGREYTNRGRKAEADGFVRAGWDRGRWHAFGDVQLRHARFRYEGDVPLDDVAWSFVNPRAGLRLQLTASSSLFASVGRVGREPTRADLFSGQDNPVAADLRGVKPERVIDVEGGWSWRRPRAAVSATLYAMEMRDEIALTGELSEIGLPLRRNVPRSHRRGVEVEVNLQPRPWLRLETTASASHDRIAEWVQFFDVYDTEGAWVGSAPGRFRGVRPLLTPRAAVNQRVELTTKGASVAAVGRWVSRTWLDNTNATGLETPAWFSLDLSASLSLERWWATGRPRLRARIDNVFGERQLYPSGYSYQYLVEGAGRTGVPYYYPQALRSVFVGLDLRM